MTEKDLIIQDSVLQQLVKWGERTPHAILLHGPRGVGKLQLAERYAQWLLCESRASAARPCGRCEGCRWVQGGNHPDLRIVEPDSMAARRGEFADAPEEADAGGAKRRPSVEIRIEQVRALEDFVHVGSHRAGPRIAIVHPAEDMNAPTANALLKNLEEPPAGVSFILVSHRPARLLATVRSRCVQISATVPDPARAARWLESQGVAGAAGWLAFSGGAPRLAAELAQGELGAAVSGWMQALERGAPETIDPGGEREAMELLVDLLQKHALDQALLSFGQASKYGGGTLPGDRAAARDWLGYARELGRRRALARHPLNPRLFAAELLNAYPGAGR